MGIMFFRQVVKGSSAVPAGSVETTEVSVTTAINVSFGQHHAIENANKINYMAYKIVRGSIITVTFAAELHQRWSTLGITIIRQIKLTSRTLKREPNREKTRYNHNRKSIGGDQLDVPQKIPSCRGLQLL